ncbi:hypothetical protein CcaverHIS002_0511040 [Cutaneotrichosporon cavernicola]|uniref:TPR-like protein n=1 Tax=Cutaneotrichosporon cavernicola TaxID=279322 RepID=A0AA48L7J3_9TREE|nr:uncharacterized protein CcaverHIS019_0511590 [Cutaneotrichosporon cavernicola]BEI85703.1 hypothetical protein CcaverHIS002_0511040 [Cutaneotrichosporon cavernicola]BEI93531.1 hypothetical protein CcaverHIS019_0511590 [Cutaneotrichosporon cavernicola]BEJ01310.1 hypothetical protein CcaverHIS631_0511670 [Cutaneotrichosporon cavernicola]BEJ09077.1 hypothetical protein CcaverHIS641_0511710 [Cutaneotrichosporon cavernicola]
MATPDVDPNRMDIDTPEPSTADSTRPATPNSYATPPSAPTAGPSSSAGSADGTQPPPWAKPSKPTGPMTEAKENGAPSPEPKKEEQPKPEPQVDISHIPPPDLNALLSKSRDPGSQIDATLIAVPELRALLDKSISLKNEGNKSFTSKPPKLDAARDSYLCALDCLPAVPKHLAPPRLDEDRFAEITDEEADQINMDWEAGAERVAVDNDIREAQKALWGNLAAVYSAQKLYKDCVDACTRALKFDPNYIKALHRRASANEHIGTWSALVSAQRDCQLLLTILPPDSTVATGVAKALDKLPQRIGAAKKREENDVGIKFGGLSTT